jgi:hypothetical protein
VTWTGAGEPLKRAHWEVRAVDIDVGERLVQRFHYAAGAANTKTYLHGLFPRGSHWEQECRGVAWWIPPTRDAAEALAGEDWGGVLALSRLAIEPGMPGNAATFLMAASVRMVDRSRWPWLVTYADEWRGHTGAIYRATGWRDAGETAPEAVYTLNGRMVARKAGGRTRRHAEMLALGCVFEGRFRKRRFVKDPEA